MIRHKVPVILLGIHYPREYDRYQSLLAHSQRVRPLGKVMKKNNPFLFIATIFFLQLAPISEGQLVPEVELSCDHPAPIEVYPGATRTAIIYCSLQNSNPYSVGVDLTYQQGVLAVSGPGSATVGAASEVDFQVVVRADLRHPEGQQVVTITATVTTANGVPVSGITEPTESKVLAIIKQFSSLRVEIDEPLVTMGVGSENIVHFTVYNDGNGRDKFNFEVINKFSLEESGWSILPHVDNIEMDSLSPPEKIRVTLIAPTMISPNNFTVLSNGSHQMISALEFKATSDYSVRNEGIANYQIAEISIKVIESQDSGFGSSLPFPNSLFSVLSICSAALFFHLHRSLR